ncbi:MAG TPA: formate dehydrogenase accessory sulfurtransferase FdhD [Methanocella sp.]|jgi:FdhD protein
MPGDTLFDTIEINGDSCQKMGVPVCEDRPVRVYLNGALAGSFETCPSDLRDLACGFFIAEGLVAGTGDLASVDVRGMDVFVTAGTGVARPPAQNEGFELDAKVLIERYYFMDDCSPLRMRTWGNHSAAIFTTAGGLVAFAEDAQRQGCICKAIGKAASAGYKPGGCFLMATGRTSPWVVAAVRRAGMPLVASFGVPSAKAVESARSSGITLVTIDGLARAIIYSGAERISGLPEASSVYESVAGAVNYR